MIPIPIFLIPEKCLPQCGSGTGPTICWLPRPVTEL